MKKPAHTKLALCVSLVGLGLASSARAAVDASPAAEQAMRQALGLPPHEVPRAPQALSPVEVARQALAVELLAAVSHAPVLASKVPVAPAPAPEVPDDPPGRVARPTPAVTMALAPEPLAQGPAPDDEDEPAGEASAPAAEPASVSLDVATEVPDGPARGGAGDATARAAASPAVDRGLQALQGRVDPPAPAGKSASAHAARVLDTLAGLQWQDPGEPGGYLPPDSLLEMAQDTAVADTPALASAAPRAPAPGAGGPTAAVLDTLAAMQWQDPGEPGGGYLPPDSLLEMAHDDAAAHAAAVASATPGAPVPGAAESAATPPGPFDGGVVAMDASQLDEVRGGFMTPDGLQISFGIERAVYINGELVTTTSLNLSQAGQVSASQAAGVAAQAAGRLTLIQSGAGNTFLPGGVSPSALGTVIQNTLNDQKIQNLTVINATVNSMEVLKSLNLESSLRGAITGSLRR